MWGGKLCLNVRISLRSTGTGTLGPADLGVPGPHLQSAAGLGHIPALHVTVCYHASCSSTAVSVQQVGTIIHIPTSQGYYHHTHTRQ